MIIKIWDSQPVVTSTHAKYCYSKRGLEWERSLIRFCRIVFIGRGEKQKKNRKQDCKEFIYSAHKIRK